MKKKFYFLVMILFFANIISIQAAKTNDNNIILTTNADLEITKILNNLNRMRFKSFDAKIAYLNQLFFNRPYIFNALGEGELAEFDDYPLYRTDAFDCETYVDTVMALAFATNLENFKDIILKIRYKNGHVSFTDRNHFTCLDWNKNNQSQLFTKDITNSIKNKNGDYIAEQAKAIIDKPNWYNNLPITRVRLQGLNDNEKNKKLEDLHAKSKEFAKELSTIAYIPLDKIFSQDDETNIEIIKQIPNGAIVEIVRPNWDLYKIIGTNMNVSHLGFVIWENNYPYFIHATSDKLMVMKTSLIDYLKNAKKNPTIKGINVQIILN